jgi:hypothetical protein
MLVGQFQQANISSFGEGFENGAVPKSTLQKLSTLEVGKF